MLGAGGGRAWWGLWYSEAAPQADTGTPPMTGEREARLAEGLALQGRVRGTASVAQREETSHWTGPGAQAPALESQETPQERAGLLE